MWVERAYENGRVDARQVELHNWPDPPSDPGGWIAPLGDPIVRWVVTRVHARYVAPAVPFGAEDGQGRPLKPRPEMHAYLLDLDGSYFGLPSFDNVVLCQMPPVGSWWIKESDEEYLARIERYRQV